jgi:hypothetical protein
VRSASAREETPRGLIVEVYSNDKPAPRIDVVLEGRYLPMVAKYVQIASADSGSSGEPAVLDLAQLQRMIAGAAVRPADVELRVLAGVSGAGGVARKLDNLPEDGAKIRIDLGFAAEIEIAVVNHLGRPVHEAVLVSGSWVRPKDAIEGPGRAMVWSETGTGRAVLGPLPVETPIDMSAYRKDHRAVSATQSEVLVAGEARRVIELVIQPRPIYTGWIVTQDNQPIVDRYVSVTVISGSRADDGTWKSEDKQGHIGFQTHAHGLFELPFLAEHVPASTRLRFELAPGNVDKWKLAAEVDISSPPSTMGPNELGMIVLLPAPKVEPTRVMLSGTLRTQGGASVERPWFYLYGRATAEGEWRSIKHEVEFDPRTGAFVLRANDDVRELLLDVGADTLLSERREGPAAGSRGHLILLEPSVKLEGSVLVDPGHVPWILFHVKVDGAREGRDLELTAPRFTVQGLAPEPVSLVVLTQETDWPVIEVRDLTAGAPHPDPRIDPLDLRGLYRIQELQILDPAGTPLLRAKIEVKDASTQIGGVLEVGDDGRVAFPVPNGIERIVVEVWSHAGPEGEEFRAVELPVGDAPVIVRLEGR